MHCNLRPLESRQSFPASITMPCQVWSHWTYLLTYYSVFAADTNFTLWYWPMTLWPWPLTLNICSVLPLTWWNSVPILNAIVQSAAGLLRFQFFDLMTLNIVLRVALGSGIIFAKFDLRQLSVLWCWCVMLRRNLHLWPVDLESSWDIKHHVINVRTKFERNRAIPGWIMDNLANFCTRYDTLWPWPLTSWAWIFTALRVSCV